MERIPDYLETLSLLMQDCAERGDLDGPTFASASELMGFLASLLPREVAA